MGLEVRFFDSCQCHSIPLYFFSVAILAIFGGKMRGVGAPSSPFLSMSDALAMPFDQVRNNILRNPNDPLQWNPQHADGDFLSPSASPSASPRSIARGSRKRSVDHSEIPDHESEVDLFLVAKNKKGRGPASASSSSSEGNGIFEWLPLETVMGCTFFSFFFFSRS